MSDQNLQKDLFHFIRSALPSHISMVDAVADLLNISHDSVYRRIRGEKPLTLDELKLLCEHFHISLDQAIQLTTSSVVFRDYEAEAPSANFTQYLQGLLQQMKYISRFQHKEMFYLAKDIPVFHFFLSRELTAFKSFFFEKSILNNPAFEGMSFSLGQLDYESYYNTGREILELYHSFDSVELWNYESIASSILQIEYYRDAGIFSSTADMYAVVDALDKMLEHLQKQAEKGRKYFPGISEPGLKASLQLYINELILGNNSILVELDGNKLAFINHVVLKYISTADARFTQKLFDNFLNLVSRSTLISETGERDRNKFFKGLRERVVALKK